MSLINKRTDGAETVDSSAYQPAPKKRGRRFGWILLVLVILIFAGIGYYVVEMMPAKTTAGAGSISATSTASTPAAQQASEYKAIFLTNNQVYFGKVEGGTNRQFLTLKDVYYLQVQEQIQPSKSKTPEQPNVSLVKLGGELHGPTDAMEINRDHVLLIEDLKVESNIVKAIENYKRPAN